MNKQKDKFYLHNLCKYENKIVLISGGRGYIGSALTQSFVDLNCKLILLDHSADIMWMPQRRRAEVSLLHGDVSSRKTWEFALPGVDYIFHLAALEYHRSNYDIMRDLQVNALSVLHLLDVCRTNEFRPKIIFSSSANIFGFVDAWPVNEKNRDNPPSLWSVHKLLAENYLRVYAQQHGIKSVVLRLANVYGPSVQQDTMTHVVINKMIAKALAGEPLIMYANQNCMRDYVFLEDVAKAFLYAGVEERLLSNGHFYVIGSEEGKTIAEVWQLIADEIKARTGKDVPIEFDSSVKIEPLDMRNFVADTTLFRQATGWKPQVLIEKGIELTIDALMSRKKYHASSEFRKRY